MTDEERRVLAEERKRWRERKGENVPGPSGASAFLGEKLARQAEPYVADVRRQVFGLPRPPFQAPEDTDASEWYWERFTRRMRKAPRQADRTLNRAVRKIAEATGFRELDILTWIACGIHPPLPRVVVHLHDHKTELPDGTVLRRRWANVEVNAPVEEREVRKTWTPIKNFWKGPGVDGLQHRSTRGGLIIRDDRRLEQLMRELPEGHHTWKERAAAWADEYGRTSPDNLRMRWRRLQEKDEALYPKEALPDSRTTR